MKKVKYPSLGSTRAHWPEMNPASCKTCARLEWKMNRLSIMVASDYSSSNLGQLGLRETQRQSHLCSVSHSVSLIDWNKSGRNIRPVKTYLVFGLVSQLSQNFQLLDGWPKKVNLDARGRRENKRIDGQKVCTKMCHYISILWFTAANSGKICIPRKTREHEGMTELFCDTVWGGGQRQEILQGINGE